MFAVSKADKHIIPQKNHVKAMKKVVLTLVLGICCATFSNAQLLASIAPTKAVDRSPFAVASWSATEITLGSIEQGKPVTQEFSFTNTGSVPLVISSVQTSCGCTASEWTKEPVLPNQKASIKVTYNAANVGTFSKTITVVSNAEAPSVQLTLKGEVVAK